MLSYGAWVTFGNQVSHAKSWALCACSAMRTSSPLTPHCLQLNVSEAQALLKQCYDAGVNLCVPLALCIACPSCSPSRPEG